FALWAVRAGFSVKRDLSTASAHLVLNLAAPPSPLGVLANATPRRFPLRLITGNLSSGSHGLRRGRGAGLHPCMSSEHFGQLAWQFKRMSGSSGLKVQAAIAC